ncbi:hypothetical protein H1Q78_17990 [Cellulosimicrobium cellulans]|uniref:hypothetical protein n=1 Tax=Cellulosimicrobium cellulans TaxID=1710 RepID=UPI001EDA95CB|nr:hypothetical protein [Cellulosimicrobium cellulans]UKJ63506.1 hypothetical protein H1Q78_17990 [Cellulosimicrobium cellulans]
MTTTTATTPHAVRAEILRATAAELETLAAAETEHRAAIAEITAESTRLRTEHVAATRDAQARHRAVPPPPDLPDPTPHRDALHGIIQARRDVVERERAALAGSVAVVEEAWQAARPDLDARAREIAAQADALAVEYGAWHRLVRETRQADERTGSVVTTNGPSTRMGANVTAVRVLDAAAGVDLCAPHPILPPPSKGALAPRVW